MMKKQASDLLTAVPTDIKIALDNFKRAIEIRKNYEKSLLDVIREEAQLVPYLQPERIVQAIMKVMNALEIEAQREKDVHYLRKVHQFYE